MVDTNTINSNPQNTPVDSTVMSALQQVMQGQNAGLAQVANLASNTSPNVPTTSSNIPVAQPQLNQQSPPWQTAPQANGHAAQKRADAGALINNIQGLVHTAAKNQQQKQIAVATNNWNLLMTAMQNPNDAQNKLVIQSILSDPKVLKQMSKALNIDWLNPAKGADNVYRQALTIAAQKHQVKTGAIESLKGILGLSKQNQPNLNPQQQAQLAQQMQSRFPNTPQNPDVLKSQITGSLYSKILSNPNGVATGINSLDDNEKQFLGIGPNANEMLRAQVQEQIASAKEAESDAKLAETTKYDAAVLAQKQAEFDSKLAADNSKFVQTQQRLSDAIKNNLAFKYADLAQKLKLAKTAQDRISIQASMTQNQNNANKIRLLNDNLTSLDKQLSIETTKLKNYQAAYKSQTGSLGTFLSKDTGVTDEGQAKIQAEQKVISDLQTQRAGVLKQQSDLLDSLNSGSGSGFGSNTSTTQSPTKTKTSETDPLGLGIGGH